MKAADMKAMLLAQAAEYHRLDATRLAEELRDFVDIIETIKAPAGKTLSALLTAVVPVGDPSHSTRSMAGVLLTIDGLSRTLSAGGLAKPADELVRLSRILQPHANRSLDDLQAAIAAGLQPAKSKATKLRKSPAGKVVDIRKTADHLSAVTGDDHAFKSALAELKAAKISNDDVFAIANMFLGRVPPRPFKSAKDAFTQMEKRHFLDALSTSRGRTIATIRV